METILIVPNNMMGHYAHLLVNIHEDVKVIYPTKFQFNKIDEYVDDDTYKVIISGFKFSQNQTDSFKAALDGINFGEDVPFTSVYHYNTYGDPILLDDVISVVEENSVPHPVLMYNEMFKSERDTDTGGVKKLIKAIEDYHKYDFNMHENSLPLTLKILSNNYGRDVHKVINVDKKQVNIDNSFYPTLYREYKHYVSKVISTANLFVVNGTTIVGVVYAENFENEIAHYLIKAYGDKGNDKVIVFVGRNTRGDDMFQIRTSDHDSLDAGRIAKAVNNGVGNKNAGTVFLGKPRESLVNALHQTLMSIV